MLKNINDRIFTYGVKGRAYYVTKSKHSSGKQGGSHNYYHLARVTYPDYTTIRIRVRAVVMDSLATLDNAARIALSEKLITDKLCQGCQGQKSREPPVIVV